MKIYPNILKRNLLNTIFQMQEDLPQYTSDPQRNFTRNQKLPFGKLCRTILSMSSQSLHVELQRQFHYEPAAADGFRVQIPSDIHDEATYFNSTKDGRGYNLLHLNALYDLESQLYLDAVMQNGREENESQALVEMVDRSELAGPVILIADRGYEAYNNMAHIAQKGWNYLIRVTEQFDTAFHLLLCGGDSALLPCPFSSLCVGEPVFGFLVQRRVLLTAYLNEIKAKPEVLIYLPQPMTARTCTSAPGAARGSTFPVMGFPSTVMTAMPFSTPRGFSTVMR